jgi:hypothetical protein
MNIEIHDLRRMETSLETLATFRCTVDGWKIHGCRIFAAPDGFIKVAGPRTSARNATEKRAVEPPKEIWFAIVRAALDAYAALPVEPDDAGMRRFLSAEQETCEMAGL